MKSINVNVKRELNERLPGYCARTTKYVTIKRSFYCHVRKKFVKNYPWSHSLEKLYQFITQSLSNFSPRFHTIFLRSLRFACIDLCTALSRSHHSIWTSLKSFVTWFQPNVPSYLSLFDSLLIVRYPSILVEKQAQIMIPPPLAWQLAWDVCAMLAYSDATLKKKWISLCNTSKQTIVFQSFSHCVVMQCSKFNIVTGL